MFIPNDFFFDDIISLLETGKSVTLRAKGNSMIPFIIGERDYVVLQIALTVEIGDIVLVYLPTKGYVLHRVYQIRGNDIVLMGDGNILSTEICCIKDVKGKVSEVIHRGRHINCTSVKEQFKAWIWRKLLPVRKYLLAIYRFRQG